MVTAILPGRFNPPHLGHILTIQRVAKEYEKVIVAVVDKMPKVIPPEYVTEILKEVFEGHRKIKVVYAGTPLIYRLNYDDLPHFDVVVSGNINTLEVMYEKGFQVKVIDESRQRPCWDSSWIREKLNATES